jgi:hypothetical protein
MPESNRASFDFPTQYSMVNSCGLSVPTVSSSAGAAGAAWSRVATTFSALAAPATAKVAAAARARAENRFFRFMSCPENFNHAAG